MREQKGFLYEVANEICLGRVKRNSSCRKDKRASEEMGPGRQDISALLRE